MTVPVFERLLNNIIYYDISKGSEYFKVCNKEPSIYLANGEYGADHWTEHNLFHAEIRRSGYENKLIGGIVLTGGGT